MEHGTRGENYTILKLIIRRKVAGRTWKTVDDMDTKHEGTDRFDGSLTDRTKGIET